MQVLIVLIVDQAQNVQFGEFLAFLELTLTLKILEVRLNDHFVELGKNLTLVLGVLAEGKDEVLGGYAGRLRASEEESEHLIYDTFVSILEVVLNQNHRKKVTSLGKLRLLLDSLSPIIYDDLAEVTKGPGIATLVPLERCDVVRCEEREQNNVRRRDSVD